MFIIFKTASFTLVLFIAYDFSKKEVPWIFHNDFHAFAIAICYEYAFPDDISETYTTVQYFPG